MVGYTVFTLSLRLCVRLSVTFCFLNILKSHCWNFIKPYKHVWILSPLNILRKDRQISPNFMYASILARSRLRLLPVIFHKLVTWLMLIGIFIHTWPGLFTAATRLKSDPPTGLVKRGDATLDMGCGSFCFSVHHNFVSSQYLQNKLIEFHKILFMHSPWQDLGCDCNTSFWIIYNKVMALE